MTLSEKEVALTLEKLGIEWRYEHPIFVWDEQGRPRVWAPDFYLVPFGIYLEVCGSTTFDYAYRKKILLDNGYQVIFLHLYKTSHRWKTYLVHALEFYVNRHKKKLALVKVHTSN